MNRRTAPMRLRLEPFYFDLLMNVLHTNIEVFNSTEGLERAAAEAEAVFSKIMKFAKVFPMKKGAGCYVSILIFDKEAEKLLHQLLLTAAEKPSVHEYSKDITQSIAAAPSGKSKDKSSKEEGALNES